MDSSPKQQNKFHYSSQLESAMRQLFGLRGKWGKSAEYFSEPKYIREALKDAIAKIRKLLDNIITADDQLLLITNSTLDTLEREIKKLEFDSNNELEIIAHLLSLVADLLGLNGFDGKVNRHVIYYQTLEQIQIDDAKRHKGDYDFGKPEYPKFLRKREEIMIMLHEQGLSVEKIAIIMKLSSNNVRDVLVRAGLMKRISKSET